MALLPCLHEKELWLWAASLPRKALILAAFHWQNPMVLCISLKVGCWRAPSLIPTTVLSWDATFLPACRDLP